MATLHVELRAEMYRRFEAALIADDWHAANRWLQRIQDNARQAMSMIPRDADAVKKVG
jgi:hypothetical protein